MKVLRPTALAVVAAATVSTLVGVLARGTGGTVGTTDLGDCETVGAGVVGQPVAAWTALGLVVAGAWIVQSGDDRDPAGAVALGLACAAAGLGSFAAHATATTGAATWDGAAVAAVLGMVGMRALRAPSWAHAVVTAVVAATALVSPSSLGTAGVVAAALAAATLALTHRNAGRSTVTGITAVGIGGAGATLWALGRTGGALCDPDSLLQPHGLWHLLAALALAALHHHLRRPHRAHRRGGPTLGLIA